MSEKRWTTFYNTCIYLTLIFFIFTLLFNFIMGMGIFTSGISGGLEMSGDGTHLVQTATSGSNEYSGGIVMDNIWSIVLIGGIGGVGLAIATQSTAIIAVYLFSIVFWGAYTNLMSILWVGGLLDNLAGFVYIGTGAIIFIFIAAVAGMLGGSG
jgi:hypothetical protein